MEKFTEIINESRTNASCKIQWSKKVLVGELNGNETLDEISDLINNALDKINNNFTEKKGFYMLICTEIEKQNAIYVPPLYIGLAYKQDLSARPSQGSGHKTAYECVVKKSNGKSLYVKLGLIVESSLDKETAQLYEDIEKCLIFCNKPSCNSQNKDNYSSERIIKIQNTGNFYSLVENSECPQK